MFIISVLHLLFAALSFRLRTNLNPKTAEKNQPIGWKLLPKSRIFPIAYVGLTVRFPELKSSMDTSARYLASPAALKTDPVQVSIESPYSGNFRLEVQKVDFTDVFGLWRLRLPAKYYLPRKYDLIYVLPDSNLLLRAAMRYEDIVAPIRRTRERAESVGVREYRQDDDFRHIHWKYSARIGKLHVKEYQKGAKDLHIVYMDLVDSVLPGEGKFKSRDYLLCAVASFCSELLHEQIPVMILAFSSDGKSEYPLVHAGRLRAAKIFLSRQIFTSSIPAEYQTTIANYAVREKATMTIFSMATELQSLSFLTQKSADFTSVALCLIPQKGFEEKQMTLTHRFSDNGIYSIILPDSPPSKANGGDLL
jgi:uncharacterized protein (DUF58 family)